MTRIELDRREFLKGCCATAAVVSLLEEVRTGTARVSQVVGALKTYARANQPVAGPISPRMSRRKPSQNAARAASPWVLKTEQVY